MTRGLFVDSSALLDVSANHDERGKSWQAVGDRPPYDPDQLTGELGFVGYGVVQGVRVDNARRQRQAEDLAGANGALAEGLRGAVSDYSRADQEGSAGASGTEF